MGAIPHSPVCFPQVVFDGSKALMSFKVSDHGDSQVPERGQLVSTSATRSRKCPFRFQKSQECHFPVYIFFKLFSLITRKRYVRRKNITSRKIKSHSNPNSGLVIFFFSFKGLFIMFFYIFCFIGEGYSCNLGASTGTFIRDLLL